MLKSRYREKLKSIGEYSVILLLLLANPVNFFLLTYKSAVLYKSNISDFFLLISI